MMHKNRNQYRVFRSIVLLSLLLFGGIPTLFAQQEEVYAKVLVVGGGASGSAAAIQLGRYGVATVVVEESPWLGGMLTSAGVSAVDGNHDLPSGIWGDFRERLRRCYGGAGALATGWVSHTLFEPSVGDSILKAMLAEVGSEVRVLYEAVLQDIFLEEGSWTALVDTDAGQLRVHADIVIDASELGDVIGKMQLSCRIGMDSRWDTGEEVALDSPNNILQDLTYVLTLVEVDDTATSHLLEEPAGYDASRYACCCILDSVVAKQSSQVWCSDMIEYGRLPGGKIMVNWPNCGNDYYVNMLQMTREERRRAEEAAKLHTLGFVYYLQRELGFRNLAVHNEYGTLDGFAHIPYHRESRRIVPRTLLTVEDIQRPYDDNKNRYLYRTNIAVGDYSIDHHHDQCLEAPEMDFLSIRVPSYGVPLGSLLPMNDLPLLAAEKNIGVSNIVNGATRLQPVVLQIGQAAAAVTYLALKNEIDPHQVEVREVQMALLEEGVYLLPFIDVGRDDPHFVPIQKAGAVGMLKGRGVPYKWANQTWVYPEDPMSEYDLIDGLRPFYPQLESNWDASGQRMTIKQCIGWLARISAVPEGEVQDTVAARWAEYGFGVELDWGMLTTRRMAAVLVDDLLNPFAIDVDFLGLVQE